MFLLAFEYFVLALPFFFYFLWSISSTSCGTSISISCSLTLFYFLCFYILLPVIYVLLPVGIFLPCSASPFSVIHCPFAFCSACPLHFLHFVFNLFPVVYFLSHLVSSGSYSMVQDPHFLGCLGQHYCRHMCNLWTVHDANQSTHIS